MREGQARSGYEAHYLPPYTPGSSPNGSPNQVARNLALLPNPLLEACKAHYYGLPGVYPTQPILPLQQFTALVQDMRDDNEAFCLVTAFCANAIIQGGMKDTPELGQLQGGLHHHGIRLLSESLRFRHAMLPFYRSHPTHLLLLTSWFYYGCYYTLGSELGRVMGREVNGEKEAWMQLKETIAQAELLGMQNEVHRHTASHIPNSGLGVLFWLLLIAER